MHRKSLYIYYFSFLLVYACKSTKLNVSTGKANPQLAVAKIIKSNLKRAPKFKTMTSRLKVEYLQGKKSLSHTVSFRMEKNKTIWMSKLGLVKALITPTRVAFYNKLDKTYFDGDFEYLSTLLGTPLDFNKIQNILLGQPLYPLHFKAYKKRITNNQYVLEAKNPPSFLEIFYLINSKQFTLDAQQIAQTNTNQFLEINYLSYQEVVNNTFPESTKIKGQKAKSEIHIALEFKGIELDKTVRFPFKIPSGYKKIK